MGGGGGFGYGREEEAAVESECEDVVKEVEIIWAVLSFGLPCAASVRSGSGGGSLREDG